MFYPDKIEPVVPSVKITRARDGTNGVAYFEFDMPSFFDPAYGEPPQEAITAMRMIDQEGTIQSVDVAARCVCVSRSHHPDPQTVTRDSNESDELLLHSSVLRRFSNGRPVGIDTKYVMVTEEEFDRFIRFMDRYGNPGTITTSKPRTMPWCPFQL